MAQEKWKKRIAPIIIKLESCDYIIIHRFYDPLLCEHVYFGICQNCPQTDCSKRRL